MTSNSTEKHAEVKERKYDLNSFASASMKVGMDQSDEEDDLPLSVRKTQNNVQKISNHQLPSTSEHPKSVNAKAPSVTIKVPTSSSVNVKAEIPSPTKNDVVKQTPSSSNGHHNNLDTNKVKNEKNHINNDADANSNSIHSDNKIKHASPKQIPMKREASRSDDEDDVSLAERAKKAKQTKTGNETKSSKKRKQETDDDYEEDEEEYQPPKKKSKSTEKDKKITPSPSKDGKIKVITTKTLTTTPTKKGGRKIKEEETVEVWKWWEEEKHEGGIKWKTLEHKGPLFAPPYIRMPENINFYYDGKPMKLSQDAEEVATFYAKMLEHDYTSMEAFNKNFFKDWRKVMNSKEKEKITDLKKCDFKEMCEYFKKISEERRNRSKEEKQKEKEERDQIQKEYGIAIIDNHKEKIGNFRIEPPGLFRGRGTHPKMGMLKKRIQPEDVIINCSKGSKIPTPPAGHKWKEVRHDNTVTWLASWSENIMGSIKYVMLNPASKIKGEKDWAKYEVARNLKTKVGKIRETYREDWKSKEMRVRQRAVALYFIDKLALRAGNEKEEGETADTVGCCSLRCEHMKLHEKLDGEENVVEFDFLGKDSIRYYNKVSVEKRVFKNLKLFMEGKNPGDDVFDRLNTMILNKHLQSLMDGLTAKVFRTYNASFTLRQQLELLTKKEMSPSEKLLAYNRANRQVAILCNHQRAVPKAHSKQMDLLQEKIKENKDKVKQAKKDAKDAKRKYKDHKTDNNKKIYEQKKKTAARLEEQLQKLELRATDKEENKEIALGTSKLNYLDPRISVAWCKKWDVPIEKVYNKTQREKFRWAIDMAGPEFVW